MASDKFIILLIGGRDNLDVDRIGDWIGVEIGVVSFGEEIVNITPFPEDEDGTEGL